MYGFILGLVVLFTTSDIQFASSRVEVAWNQWQQQGYQLEQNFGSIDGFLGPIHLYTYSYEGIETSDYVLLHTTFDGKLFDVSYMISLYDYSEPDPLVWHSHVILNRLLWLATTGDIQLFRAQIQTPGIELTSNTMLSTEDLTMAFARFLRTGGFNLEIFDDELSSVFTVVLSHQYDSFKIRIAPSLNLITNGDASLYRDYLTDKIRNNEPFSVKVFSPHYMMIRESDTLTYALPDYGIYRASWKFLIEDDQATLQPNGVEIHNRNVSVVSELTDSEGEDNPAGDYIYAKNPDWIFSHIAYWSTIGFPDSLRQPGLSRVEPFNVHLSVMAETPVNIQFDDPGVLSHLKLGSDSVMPSYFQISEISEENGYTIIYAYWLIYNPELKFQHIMRITDRFSVSGNNPVWIESNVNSILGLRVEQIESLDAVQSDTPFENPINIRIRQ